MISAANFERRIKEINAAVAKIQEAVQNRVFQYDSYLETARSNQANNIERNPFQKAEQINTELSENVEDDDNQIHQAVPRTQSRIMPESPGKRGKGQYIGQEQMLEYFIDEFSNLHAICDSALSNDDDWEQLQLLINILNDDFFSKAHSQGQQHRVFKEREDQLLIFAKRLEREVTQKLIVFEEYAQQQQDFQNHSNIHGAESNLMLEDCEIASAEKELLRQKSNIQQRGVQSELEDGDQLDQEPTPRDLMNQSIPQDSGVKDSSRQESWDPYERALQSAKGSQAGYIDSARQAEEHQMARHQLMPMNFSGRDTNRSRSRRINKEVVLSARKRNLSDPEQYLSPGREPNAQSRSRNEQMKQNTGQPKADTLNRNQKVVGQKQTVNSVAKPSPSAGNHPYLSIDEQAMQGREPSVVTFADGSARGTTEKNIQSNYETFAFAYDVPKQTISYTQDAVQLRSGKQGMPVAAYNPSPEQYKHDKFGTEMQFEDDSQSGDSNRKRNIQVELNQAALDELEQLEQQPDSGLKKSSRDSDPKGHRSTSIQAHKSTGQRKLEKRVTSTPASASKRSSQRAAAPGLALTSGKFHLKQSVQQNPFPSSIVKNRKSNRSSQGDANSNQNTRSQFQDDAQYCLFKLQKSSSGEEGSNGLQQNISIEQSLELQMVSESSSQASWTPQQEAGINSLLEKRYWRYVTKTFRSLNDNVLAGRASKAVSEELQQKRKSKILEKCMRQIKLHWQRQCIVKMMLANLGTRSREEVFHTLRKHAVNSKRYRAMKFSEAVQVHTRKINKEAFRGLDIWRRTMRIQKAEEAAEKAHQAQQEKLRQQAYLEAKRKEAERLENLRKCEQHKVQFRSASIQIVDQMIEETLDQLVQDLAQDQVKEQTKLKHYHQKNEQIAISKFSEELLEQIQRHMLIDIIYRSKREIEDANQKMLDDNARQITDNIYEKVLNEQVMKIAGSSIILLKHDEEVTQSAGEEIINELCDDFTAQQVRVILFELRMAAKLDLNKNIKQHNANINEFWTDLVNQQISQTVKEVYQEEVKTHISTTIGGKIEQSVVQNSLNMVAKEAILHEATGLSISSQLGDNMIKSIVDKLVKETYRDISTHEQACEAVCDELQNDVTTNMLDEIIDEYQDEAAKDKALMKRALKQYTKELMYNVVTQNVNTIVWNELSHASASQQVGDQIVETSVLKQVKIMCAEEVREEEITQKATQVVRDEITDKVLKQILVDVVKTTYMDQMTFNAHTNIAVGAVTDEIIDNVVAQSVQSIAQKEVKNHDEHLNVVNSMVEDQIHLLVKDIALAEMQYVQLQDKVANDFFNAYMDKISKYVIVKQLNALKLEEEQRLLKEIEALEKLASDKAISEEKQREEEQLAKLLNVSFSGQNREEFAKIIIEEVEEEKEDEPIQHQAQEDVRSTRLGRRNLFSKKKGGIDDGSSAGYSGRDDGYGVFGADSRRKTFLPSQRLSSKGSHPSVSPRREPEGKSKRITLHDISQAAAARYSVLSKASKGEQDDNHSAHSPVLTKANSLNQDLEEEKKVETNLPIRKALNMDMDMDIIPQEESKLEETQETKKHFVPPPTSKAGAARFNMFGTQETKRSFAPPPTSKAGAAKFNMFGSSNKKKSLEDGFSKFEQILKKTKENEKCQTQMDFEVEEEGNAPYDYEDRKSDIQSMRSSMKSNQSLNMSGTKGGRTFKKFLSDKKSPVQQDDVIQPKPEIQQPIVSNWNLDNNQVPHLQDQKNAQIEYKSASKSPRPTKAELFKPANANLEKYKEKHNIVATKSDGERVSAYTSNSKSPMRKNAKNLFGKKNKN